MIKGIIKGFVCFLIFGAIGLFCHRQTAGFSLGNMRSNVSYHPEWVTESVSEQACTILKHSFSYLGKGKQSFAFVSDDGQYVLKLFRHDRISRHFWLDNWPCPAFLQNYRKEKLEKRELRLHRNLGGYKLAFDVLKEESGLLFVHLNQTENLLPQVVLYDKIGIRHLLNLDQMTFVLQKRANLLYPTIDKLLKEGQIEKARSLVRKIGKLLLLRCQKGVVDEDPGIHKNLGILGEEPIFIDLGSFEKYSDISNAPTYRENLLFATEKFKLWLQEKHPAFLPLFEEEMQEMLK